MGFVKVVILPTIRLSLVCLCIVLISVCASAQEIKTADFDREAYIQSEIEKQRTRLNSSNEEERRDSVLRLGWLKTVESSRAAVTALNDSSDIVRATAVQAILSLPSNEAVNYLIPLLRDKSEFVRQETAYALGETKNQGAVSSLLAVFNNKKEKPGVRGAVALAFGLIRDSSVIPTLLQALQENKNTNPFIQLSIVRSLGQLKAKEALYLLIALLSDEKVDIEVRREAANSLGGLRDLNALPALSQAMFSSDPYLSKIARASFNVIKLEVKN